MKKEIQINDRTRQGCGRSGNSGALSTKGRSADILAPSTVDSHLLDHFTVAEFLACVEAGWEANLTGRDATFLFDVEKRFTEFRESMRFSERQAAYLRALARRGGRVPS